MIPSEDGEVDVHGGQVNGENGGNLLEAVRHWDFWKQIPDVNDFGKSIDGVAFMREGGDFMKHMKRLDNLHSGEVVEIKDTGSWNVVYEHPPMDAQGWHGQFAGSKQIQALLRDIGAPGTQSHASKARAWTMWGASPDGIMPDEVKVKLRGIYKLTHTTFQEGCWDLDLDDPAGYLAREAKVLTLFQVLMLDPEHTTMQEAYVWFCQQRRICKARVHSPKAGKGYGAHSQYETKYRAWNHNDCCYEWRWR